jgi:hypothetical protein
MKKKKSFSRIAVIILAVAVFHGPGGCGKGIDRAREPFPEIIWPGPPEKPRIRFVGAVSRPEELQIKPGLFGKFFSYLIGKDERSMVAPYGVGTDDSGRLYVVDTFLRTVHVFDANRNKYYPLPADKA